MTTSTQLPKDDPLWLAWVKFKQSEAYKNAEHWAKEKGHEENVLWSAFSAGYLAK